MSNTNNNQSTTKNDKPKIAPQGGKENGSNKKDLSNTQNVLHHVGMVVNGFEIQKLIGKCIRPPQLGGFANQYFRYTMQARENSRTYSRRSRYQIAS